MQELLKSGKVKSIGVANFSTHHCERLASATTTTVVPAVNQGEQINDILLAHFLASYSRDASVQSPGVVGEVLQRKGYSLDRILTPWIDICTVAGGSRCKGSG
ncbi:hypothetical protein V1505DRAFT_381470 [Lipomyces doorenjongii]